MGRWGWRTGSACAQGLLPPTEPPAFLQQPMVGGTPQHPVRRDGFLSHRPLPSQMLCRSAASGSPAVNGVCSGRGSGVSAVPEALPHRGSRDPLLLSLTPSGPGASLCPHIPVCCIVVATRQGSPGARRGLLRQLAKQRWGGPRAGGRLGSLRPEGLQTPPGSQGGRGPAGLARLACAGVRARTGAGRGLSTAQQPGAVGAATVAIFQMRKSRCYWDSHPSSRDRPPDADPTLAGFCTETGWRW